MTELELVNYALDRLGAQNITSYTDTTSSPYAAMVGRFFDHFRDEILRLTTWPFAMKTVQLVELLSCGETGENWTAKTEYAVGDIVASRGRLYTCITEGISASSGGPTGTTSDITDGTAHWSYTSALVVDADDGTYGAAWQAGTVYVAGDLRVNAGRVYRCMTGGTSAAVGNGPTTTTYASPYITDNTAYWKYVRDLGANLTEYAYRYGLPSDCLRVKDVDGGEDYLLEFQVLHTDGDGVIRYVHRLEDIELWDNLACDALILRMAAAMAPTITGQQRPDLLQEFASIAKAAINAGKGEATRGGRGQTLFVEEA